MITSDKHPPPKETQRQMLLAALAEHGALTTTDCRDYLGICHPAGRVFDLRLAGHDIRSTMVCRADSEGRLHRQAVYALGVSK